RKKSGKGQLRGTPLQTVPQRGCGALRSARPIVIGGTDGPCGPRYVQAQKPSRLGFLAPNEPSGARKEPEIAMSQTTTSLRPLGVCWVVYGVLRLAVAIGLVLYFGTSTVMFGALLSRVANPFSLMDLFHILYVLAIGWCVIGGLLAILAGIALTGDNRT